MYKLASVALTAALGVAGVAQSVPAEAHPYVSVGVGLPGVAVVEPFAYAPGFYGVRYNARGGYGRHDFGRDRDDRFHRRWDHDGGRRWDRR
jgi:hypothetical protein